MLTMLALGAVWCALHEPEWRCWWLAGASAAYGLALGARPNLLYGAAILVVPVAQAWRERRRLGTLLMAATGPITVIGLGLMLYNQLRFDKPFEFGLRYLLTIERDVSRQLFNPHFLWFNFRVYFLEPARWSGHFPFAHDIAVPPWPAGYAWVENPFGILTNIPVVWLALAVPLAWRNRSGQAASTLRWFVTAVALLFGACLLPLLFYESAIIRYEVDFAPALVLLAVVGLLGLERALANRPVWRRAARWGYGLLLAFSVAFNLFASVGRFAETHYNLGNALLQANRLQEAIGEYEQALRINPDYADAHNNLGTTLVRTGRIKEAIAQYEQGILLTPDDARAHNNLGGVLLQMGKPDEAIVQFEQAIRIQPDLDGAHANLGNALLQLGKTHEAISHYEEALRINPDFAEAHMYLGNAFLQEGEVQNAIAQYRLALKFRPDWADARNALAKAQLGQ
jgi:tetratricopeptide (TPR) repeat protein